MRLAELTLAQLIFFGMYQVQTMKNVYTITHPLVQHKLTLMRRAQTSTAKFRALLKEISMLLAYEVTRDLPLRLETIETPLATMEAPVLSAEKKLVVVSIMRAGQGILDGILELIPSARVGHIGLYRDPQTLRVIEYYLKFPHDMEDRDVLVVDPMIATREYRDCRGTPTQTGPTPFNSVCLPTCGCRRH